jgi:hypothetical protein
MTNAERLLLRLDALLDAPVELTLYGRAALALGYPRPKPEFARSMDVDAVLWLGQAELLECSGNFWKALDRLNAEFEASGLYMTHLFDETQVILSPDWRIHRVPIPLAAARLSVSRLSDADLMLSKLMRYDPIDLDDLRFIVTASGLSPEAVAHAVRAARVPDSEELREQFALCRQWLISQALCAAG